MNYPFTKSEFFRKNIHPWLAKLPFYDCWLLKRKSFLKTSGWYRSFKTGRSVDRLGEPIPWFTYNAIRLLQDRLPEKIMVFEYGCGMGTHWWAERSMHVDVVEHNPDWIRQISDGISERVNLMHRVPGVDYAEAVSESDYPYDVIVVDGKVREDCCRHSIHHLTKGGIIVLDDTDREVRKGAIEFLKNRGFRQLSLVGFSPIEFMECETSIFYRNGNLLGL